MDKAIAVFKISQKILGYIISLMLIGMVVVICMQTFFRYCHVPQYPLVRGTVQILLCLDYSAGFFFGDFPENSGKNRRH